MSGGKPLPIGDLVREGTAVLAAAGVASPRADAELLAAHVLGVGRGDLLARLAGDRRISDDDAARYADLVAERARRRPLQHLTGRAPFRHLDLRVGTGVFVPRPETELLAGWAIEAAAAAGPAPLVVDLCTGSGAIALAVADELGTAEVVAVEREDDALAWARVNLAERPPSVRERVDLRAGDVTALAARPPADLAGRADVVTANPPYIPDGAVPLEIEVARHDPAAALYGGGEDGLDVPRAVVALAAALLRPGGTLLMEHGEAQGAATRALASAPPWRDVATRQDLSGRDRVLQAWRVEPGRDRRR